MRTDTPTPTNATPSAPSGHLDATTPGTGQPVPGEDPPAGEDVGLAAVVRELRRVRELLEAQTTELLDARQAARFLGVSEATLYRLRAAGEVPASVRLGGGALIRWRRNDLQNYIEKLRPAR